MKRCYKKHVLLVSIFLLAISCTKQNEFLDERPSNDLLIPSKLEDCQLILRNEGIFNASGPGLGTLSADEYYVSPNVWQGSMSIERNAYIWAKDVYEGNNDIIADWSHPYTQIYYANVVLEALEKMDNGTPLFYHLKGTALFFRSVAFYNLVQTYAMPYDEVTADKDMGIVLRLSPDLNIKYGRASVEECHNQIINDLETSLNMLPESPAYLTSPSKAAANAMLSRVNLSLRQYDKALKYANACLQSKNTLIDYNTLTPTDYTINNTDKYLVEDLFHASNTEYSILSASNIDSNLYKLYNENDLRKTVFFNTIEGRTFFKGTYDVKGSFPFGGLALDEVVLNRAECLARSGNVQAALKDLNWLLRNRWKTGTYKDISETNPQKLLQIILTERRKELLFRGIRWTDIRRLNKEPGFALTLKRKLNGTIYSLPPNDLRYAFTIPYTEVLLNNIPQNQR